MMNETCIEWSFTVYTIAPSFSYLLTTVLRKITELVGDILNGRTTRNSLTRREKHLTTTSSITTNTKKKNVFFSSSSLMNDEGVIQCHSWLIRIWNSLMTNIIWYDRIWLCIEIDEHDELLDWRAIGETRYTLIIEGWRRKKEEEGHWFLYNGDIHECMLGEI
jgi:hypothetical protein